MKVDKVKVMVGQTFNLGNYQSGRVDAGIEATVEEGETHEQAHEKAFLAAKKAFTKFAANFIPKKENGS